MTDRERPGWDFDPEFYRAVHGADAVNRAKPIGMAIATKLSEARKLIERGWHQGWFVNDDDTCVCAMGAINIAQWGSPLPPMGDTDRKAALHMADIVKQAIGTVSAIPHWNDNSKRTQAEVIEAFKRAEQLARDGAE